MFVIKLNNRIFETRHIIVKISDRPFKDIQLTYSEVVAGHHLHDEDTENTCNETVSTVNVLQESGVYTGNVVTEPREGKSYRLSGDGVVVKVIKTVFCSEKNVQLDVCFWLSNLLTTIYKAYDHNFYRF